MTSAPHTPPVDRTGVPRFDPTIAAEAVRARMANERERCPVSHDPVFGYGLVGRHAEGREVLLDHARFSSADGVFEPRPPGLPFLTALEQDGEAHRTGRASLPELGVRAVREYEPVIREVVDHFIDQLAARGRADLFADFAEPVPAVVLGRVVGLDLKQSMVNRRLAMATIDAMGPGPLFARAWAEYREFVLSLLADRRAVPREDYLSELARGRVGDGDDAVTLTDDEAFTVVATLLMGGHHSTASGLVGLLHHILTVPELRRTVETGERGALRAAVEESLRLSTPLNFFARTATVDTTVGGCPVGKGERVVVDLVSANRDPRKFTDPETFVAGRTTNPHLAFGVGLHVCPGQHLARTELRLAAAGLLRRLPDIVLDGEPRHSGLHGGSMLFVQELPVRFTPVR